MWCHMEILTNANGLGNRWCKEAVSVEQGEVWIEIDSGISEYGMKLREWLQGLQNVAIMSDLKARHGGVVIM
jgi:hypothetical protein